MTSKGNIYKIICKSDSSIVYIGSTFKRLLIRWDTHKSHYKHNHRLSIYDYFDKYGFDNFEIILIKSYDCIRTHNRDFKHLHAYETLWINKTKNCVNEKLPFSPMKYLNRKARKEYGKNYYKNNKEKCNELGKKNYQENKEKYIEKSKKNYENNKDEIKEKRKKYRKEHKDEISEKGKIKMKCECGSVFRKSDLARHKKTKKHLNFIN